MQCSLGIAALFTLSIDAILGCQQSDSEPTALTSAEAIVDDGRDERRVTS